MDECARSTGGQGEGNKAARGLAFQEGRSFVDRQHGQYKWELEGEAGLGVVPPNGEGGVHITCGMGELVKFWFH